MTPESGEIRRKVQSAIDKFKQRDSVLLEIDVNERTMTHKLAEYLQQEFQEWDVDCEYNRKIKDLKKLPRPPKNLSDGTTGTNEREDSLSRHNRPQKKGR